MTVKTNQVYGGDVNNTLLRRKKENKENKNSNKFLKKKSRKNNKKKNQSKKDIEKKRQREEKKRQRERERRTAREEKSVLQNSNLLSNYSEEKEKEQTRIQNIFEGKKVEFGQLKNPYNSSSDSSDSDESYFSIDPVNFVTGRLPNKEEEQQGIIGMIVYENSDPVYVFNKSY